MNKISTRSEALSQGLNRYFTGVPCKYGHISERSVSARKCVQCANEQNAKRQIESPEKKRAATTAWYAANREEIRRKRNQIYKDNPKKELAGIMARRKANPDFVKACAEYYQKNKAAITKRNKEYVKAHPEKRRIHCQNTEARRKSVSGKLSKTLPEKLKRLQKCMCANCHADLLKTGYHLDHIMPIALGGENCDENIQLLCPTCNLSKSAKHPIEWARQHGRLL